MRFVPATTAYRDAISVTFVPLEPKWKPVRNDRQQHCCLGTG
jgi:hypothetical protein